MQESFKMAFNFRSLISRNKHYNSLLELSDILSNHFDKKRFIFQISALKFATLALKADI